MLEKQIKIWYTELFSAIQQDCVVQNMIRAQLKEMKEKKGLTNKQLAELSGVSLPTVNRIMSGQTDVPNYQTVCDLVMAMGGSLDELAGIPLRSTERPEWAASSEMYIATIKEKDLWIKRLFFISCALVVVLLGILIFDYTHPMVGFIQR